jgi:hypothetical protein
MKTNIKLLLLLSLIIFSSCKDDKKTEEETNNESVKNDFFSVELDVINLLEDNFALYYTEDNTINFDSDKAVWSGVKSLSESQKVTFKLSEELIPTDIRLDFGLNKEQKEVILENVKMDYYGKSFQFKGSDFLNYYRPNDSIKTEIDQVKGSIKFIQNPKQFNPAFFYPNEKMLEEIAKITK